MPDDATTEFFKATDGKPTAATPDPTQPMPATEPNGDSRIFNVSLRGWLALILVGTLCAMSARALEVKEPLYTIVTVAVSFYFGQKTKS